MTPLFTNSYLQDNYFHFHAGILHHWKKMKLLQLRGNRACNVSAHIGCSTDGAILPSLSLSLSGRARGPVSDQSPLRRRRFTGGCLSWGNTYTHTHSQSKIAPLSLLSVNGPHPPLLAARPRLPSLSKPFSLGQQAETQIEGGRGS